MGLKDGVIEEPILPPIEHPLHGKSPTITGGPLVWTLQSDKASALSNRALFCVPVDEGIDHRFDYS